MFNGKTPNGLEYNGTSFTQPAIGRTEEFLAIEIRPVPGTARSAWLDLIDYDITGFGTGPRSVEQLFPIILKRKLNLDNGSIPDNLWNRLLTVEATCELIDRETGKHFADFDVPDLSLKLGNRLSTWVESRVKDILKIAKMNPQELQPPLYVSAGVMRLLGGQPDPGNVFMVDGARRLMAAVMHQRRNVPVRLIVLPEEYASFIDESSRLEIRSQLESLSWFDNYQTIDVIGIQGRRSLRRFELIDFSLFRDATVIDFGCNIGQTAINAAVAGASRVLGLDGMDDTIRSAKDIQSMVGLPNLEYHLIDFNEHDFNRRIDNLIPQKADYTFFLSLYRTKELTQRERLFEYILTKTAKTCFFEGHADPKIDTLDYYRDLFNRFGVAGEFLGYGEPNLRPLYRIDLSTHQVSEIHTTPMQTEIKSKDVTSTGIELPFQQLLDNISKRIEQEASAGSERNSSDLTICNREDDNGNVKTIFGDRPPTVAVLYLTYNRLEYTKLSLKALLENTEYPFELHIVDNGSTDGTQEWLEQQRDLFPEVIRSLTLNNENRGLAAPTNEFWDRTGTDLIGKVDNDTLVPKGWLSKLVEAHLNSDRLGVIGGFHFQPEDFVESLCLDRLLNVDSVGILRDRHIGGCCYIMKRKVQQVIGHIKVDPQRKIMGWTEFQHAIDNAGYLNGYYYPLMYVDHMDDPRSEHHLSNATYLKYTRHVWRDRKIDVQDPSIITQWIIKDARRVMRGDSLQKARRIELQNPPIPLLKPEISRTDIPVGVDNAEANKVIEAATSINNRQSDTQNITSIIIPVFNQIEYTLACIESIEKHTRSPYEIIVVDNGSTDGTEDRIKALDNSRISIIINPENRGFGPACNQGIKAAKGNYLIIINNDTLVTRGWLDGLIRAASQDSVIGMVGPMSNYISHPEQFDGPAEYGDLNGMESHAWDFRKRNSGKITQTDRLVFVCVLLRRELLDSIGNFDEEYAIGNYEDDDLCWRARQSGYKLAVAKEVFIHHFGSRTFISHEVQLNHRLQMQANGKRFFSKFGIDPGWYKAQIQRPPRNLLIETSLNDFRMHTTSHSPQLSISEEENIASENAEEYFKKAVEEIKQNRLESALETFDKVLEMDPLHVPTLTFLRFIEKRSSGEWKDRREEFVTDQIEKCQGDERLTWIYRSAQFFEAPSSMQAIWSFIEKGMIQQPPDTSFEPLVSIVLTCHNHALFVSDAIKSVLAQTFTNWELIIVNDGSTDKSNEVINHIISNNPDYTISYIELEGVGPAAARNRGAKDGKAPLLLFLDADDMIAHDFLMHSVKALRENSRIGFVWPISIQKGRFNRLWSYKPFNILELLMADRLPVTSLMRREMFDEIDGFSPEMKEAYEDWDFWLSAVEQGWIGQRVEKALFLYRKHENTRCTFEIGDKREIAAKQTLILRHQDCYLPSAADEMDLLRSKLRISHKLVNMDWVKKYCQGQLTGVKTRMAERSLETQITLATKSPPPFRVSLESSENTLQAIHFSSSIRC